LFVDYNILVPAVSHNLQILSELDLMELNQWMFLHHRELHCLSFIGYLLIICLSRA